MAASIANKTGIDKDCVISPYAVNSQCSSTIFRWAAHRRTSRVEDRAYSLLGLCGVNMPLLYGEGFSAFTRLQQAIVTERTDESIFAFHPRVGHLLASVLNEFAYAVQPGVAPTIQSLSELSSWAIPPRSLSWTNLGIQMRVSYIRVDEIHWAVAFQYMHDDATVPFMRIFKSYLRPGQRLRLLKPLEGYKREEREMIKKAEEIARRRRVAGNIVFDFADAILEWH